MIIKNGTVFQENGLFVQKDISIKDAWIVETSTGEELDAFGMYVIPGLIDIHFHGCVGHDFCDGTEDALRSIAKYQLSQGITSICPASMTFEEAVLTKIFFNAAQYENKEGATLVGINMEGPFISMEKKGAQNGAFIQKPDAEMFLRLQEKAGGLIRLVDIAPEVEGAMMCIEAISNQVVVSLAHTAADYSIAEEAFQKGARHVTHLYNGMTAFSHREPGVIGAACDNEHVMVELICDGVHNHPATVRTTFKMFGDDRIILISDSMRACGLKEGQYTLGGQSVTIQGRRAVLTGSEVLAGSVTNLMECVKNAVQTMGIPFASAVKCATVNPAKAIGIFDRYGSLTSGKYADMVLLDQNLEIQYIIKSGKIVYHHCDADFAE